MSICERIITAQGRITKNQQGEDVLIGSIRRDCRSLTCPFKQAGGIQGIELPKTTQVIVKEGTPEGLDDVLEQTRVSIDIGIGRLCDIARP